MKENIKFKNFRKANSLTQLELSSKLGVSRSLIADIERGKATISKKLMSKFIQNFDIEAAIFDNEDHGKNDMSKQGVEAGGRQGVSKTEGINPDLKQRESSVFPNDYWSDDNFYLRSNFQKKLFIDILRNYQNINELTSYLSTLQNFEYIIDNLNDSYFNKIQFQFHSTTNYLENGKFKYDEFRADYIKEVEKLESIRPALAKLCQAIEAFYTEIKDFDTENIVTGYFGSNP